MVFSVGGGYNDAYYYSFLLQESNRVLFLFVAIVTVIAPIVIFRYSFDIPLPINDGLAIYIAFVFIGLTVATSLLDSFVFLIWVTSNLTQLLPLIPIAIIGTGMYEVLSYWGVREKAFYSLANTKVLQKIIRADNKNWIRIGWFKVLEIIN